MKPVPNSFGGEKFMVPVFSGIALSACAFSVAAFAADGAPATADQASPPSATTLSSEARGPARAPRYKASFSLLTSRSASNDLRSFRSSATDDSGAVTEGSALPNMSYLSSRLSVSPWPRHTFSLGDLQSLDSASHRTVLHPGGGGFPLPSSIWSVRYGYRMNDHWNVGLAETYVQGRKYSDPMIGLNFRTSPVTIRERFWISEPREPLASVLEPPLPPPQPAIATPTRINTAAKP